MFYRAKLLIVFHSLVIFSTNVINAIYNFQTNEYVEKQEIQVRFYTYLLFIVCILFINMWEIVKYWIDSREKEFYIRWISGAQKKQIIGLFFYDYLKIVLCSLVLGYVLLLGFSKLPIEFCGMIFADVGNILWIMILSYLIPILVGMVIIWRRQKRYETK